MPPPPSVHLGPRSQAVIDNAVWRATSDFPAHQAWADDFEQVLSFLESADQWGRFFPRLTAREWEGAGAEARTAYFFHRNGFLISGWEPEAVAGRPGDLEITWQSCEPIFVEVKGPGWEGELTPEELKAGRQHEPKYQDLQGRWVDPIGPALRAIDKALPKLSPTRCNLVTLADDLFWSPIDLPEGMFARRIESHLATTTGSVVGGVYLLNPVTWTGTSAVEYRKYFVLNRHAMRPLPEPVIQGFLQGNHDAQGPPWARM